MSNNKRTQEDNVAAGTSEVGKRAKVVSESSIDVKERTPACTFQKLGEDAHIHILSYILCLPPSPEKPEKNHSSFWHYRRAMRPEANLLGSSRDKTSFAELTQKYMTLIEDEREAYVKLAVDDRKRYEKETKEYETSVLRMHYLPAQLANLCREMTTVSKYWRRVVGKLMNLNAPRDVLCPSELADIKSQVGKLDLSAAKSAFRNLCADMFAGRRFLPSDLYHDDDRVCPLEVIVQQFASGSYERLADNVANEYRRFLVVKCVEIMAARKHRNGFLATTHYCWLQSSVPGQLCHVFWLAHMSSPRQYASDCEPLVGEIIDCSSSSYQSVVPGSVHKYLTKRKTLFAFEKQLSALHFFAEPRAALYLIEDVIETASILRDEQVMLEQRDHETDVDHTDVDHDTDHEDAQD